MFLPEDPPVHRLSAFTERPDGGNPAGVVVSDAALPPVEMQRIAAEVGYSETAFLYGPGDDRRSWQVRYFSPVAEVPFCGHATIAAAVVLGGTVGTGTFTLRTVGGPVPVEVARTDGVLVATLTSVPPNVQPAPEGLVSEVIDAAGIVPSRLDERYPPAVAFAGARHLLLVLVDRSDLQGLSYDFDRVLAVMTAHELTTVALLWPAPDGVWHARNLFPVGGVVEDPATGAAAAAFGAYLRSIDAIATPGQLDIVQGVDMGRPSRLHVTVPAGAGGISVSGGAVPIPTTPDTRSTAGGA
jgi:PhzF family phenazine biosynthesis protein